MEGSVSKRKDGRWQGTVELPSLSKKRERKYVYASTRQECRRKMNELIEEIEKNGVINPTKYTFNEFANKWLDTYCVNLSPTTVDGYKKVINTYMKDHLKDVYLAKILPINLQQIINSFSKNHSEKTCRNVLGVLNSIFKYAMANKILRSNPCEGIKIQLDKDKYEYYIYSEEEFNKLLEYVTGTIEEIPILLAGLCGLRVSEIMALRWNDIDFKNRVISIHNANVHVNGTVIEKNTKTRTSYREVVAPNYVIERLSIYKGIGYIYPKKDGTAENGGNYSKRFSRILKKAELPHTRFHDLRHFNATIMLKNGITDKEAAKRLGHSDINMTKKYQHVLKNMENRPAEVLDNVVTMSVKMSVNL